MSDGSDEERDAAVDSEEWRFSIDDFPDPDGASERPASDDHDGDDDRDGNVAGTLETRQPLEPGDIDLENAFFVAVGILIVIGLIVGALFGF